MGARKDPKPPASADEKAHRRLSAGRLLPAAPCGPRDPTSAVCASGVAAPPPMTAWRSSWMRRDKRAKKQQSAAAPISPAARLDGCLAAAAVTLLLCGAHAQASGFWPTENRASMVRLFCRDNVFALAQNLLMATNPSSIPLLKIGPTPFALRVGRGTTPSASQSGGRTGRTRETAPARRRLALFTRSPGGTPFLVASRARLSNSAEQASRGEGVDADRRSAGASAGPGWRGE